MATLSEIQYCICRYHQVNVMIVPYTRPYFPISYIIAMSPLTLT